MNLKKITEAALAGLLARQHLRQGWRAGKKRADSAKSADGKKIVTVAHTNYYVPVWQTSREPDGFEVAVMEKWRRSCRSRSSKFVPTSDDDL